MQQIGITEFSDPQYNNSWERWTLNKREPTILISKNMPEILKKYPGIENQNNIIFHWTCTGYGSSQIEPNVPNPQIIINSLKNISDSQKKRIVIRIDPIIPTEDCIKQSLQIFNITKNLGFERHRISILDLYPKVIKRLENKGMFVLLKELKDIYNWDMAHSGGEHKDYMIHAPFQLRKNIIDQFDGSEVYGEPYDKLEIPKWNIKSCISKDDLNLLGIKSETRYPINDQREFCGCLGIKKQLLRGGSCQNNCVYCYMGN